MLVSSLTGTHKPNPDKLAEYECGFPAFEDPRSQFDVRFYLVAILFIVFDLQAAFLFPSPVRPGETGWTPSPPLLALLFPLLPAPPSPPTPPPPARPPPSTPPPPPLPPPPP